MRSEEEVCLSNAKRERGRGIDGWGINLRIRLISPMLIRRSRTTIVHIDVHRGPRARACAQRKHAYTPQAAVHEERQANTKEKE